jgi:tRNA nucleotidyltransferase/poly(A) polymerase
VINSNKKTWGIQLETKLYRVGGAVRDALMGLKSKDIDFAVEADSYETMKAYILSNGGTIFLEKPEYFTIRAKLNKQDADFVLCRRPDSVQVGTILDDLARRDFTMNAIAIRENDSEVIDPFNGLNDIKERVIRCVGNPFHRFSEDSLRLLRALRFALTKGFALDASVAQCMWSPALVMALANVSKERIREELYKCFKHNTLQTLTMLESYPMVRDMVFDSNIIWLKPTMEDNGHEQERSDGR